MTARPTVWPSRDDYQAAMLQPRRHFKDARLHNLEVEARLQIGGVKFPSLRSGNFGAVYKFQGRGPALAVKVFDRLQPDRQQRYRMIAEHLAGCARLGSLVSFRYDEEGILIGSRWYPVLIMDWAEGRLLDLYLRDALSQGGIDNAKLSRTWVDLVINLQERRVAHGDLQHGNILVQPDGTFKLVDYDGMFVPAMRAAGLTAAEIGLPAYQHPKRFRGYFDDRLDDFSALVVLLSLAAATPERWSRFHTDDNCLLLREADLVRPEQSPLLGELLASPDAPLRKLALLVKVAALGSLEDIPPFEMVAGDEPIQQLWGPSAATRGTTVPARGGVSEVGEESAEVRPNASSSAGLQGTTDAENTASQATPPATQQPGDSTSQPVTMPQWTGWIHLVVFFGMFFLVGIAYDRATKAFPQVLDQGGGAGCFGVIFWISGLLLLISGWAMLWKALTGDDLSEPR